jgi:hypothetical protein
MGNYVLNGQAKEKLKIRYIDYFFENGSPVSWNIQGYTLVKVSLLADYERNTINRQTGHWNFKLFADSGSRVRIVLSKMVGDVYNGTLSTSWWNFVNDISCYISYDRKSWEAVRTLRMPGMELLLDFKMKGNSVYIARIPPYTVSDLENLKTRIAGNKLVKIFNIGETVEKRALEIIRLGNPDAPNSIIVRARAHPWEPGGSWVVEGLINTFISRDSKKWQETFCVYIMPMANKDGVVRGMTRFNVSGIDLNRNWDKPADSVLSPENHVLEKFLKELADKGVRPCLGIDIHNDDDGGINLAQHNRNDLQFIRKAELFEKLMRKNTSFSESVRYSWKSEESPLSNVSFENGLTTRYGIESITYELNANWISSLKKMPSREDWMETGGRLNDVFYEYLGGSLK